MASLLLPIRLPPTPPTLEPQATPSESAESVLQNVPPARRTFGIWLKDAPSRIRNQLIHPKDRKPPPEEKHKESSRPLHFNLGDPPSPMLSIASREDYEYFSRSHERRRNSVDFDERSRILASTNRLSMYRFVAAKRIRRTVHAVKNTVRRRRSLSL